MFAKFTRGPMTGQSDDSLCPHFHSPCLRGNCAAWIQVHGQNPQTGEAVDGWGCATYHWLPLLLIENSQQTRQAGAALESFRNETVRAAQMLAHQAQRPVRLVNAPEDIPDDDVA